MTSEPHGYGQEDERAADPTMRNVTNGFVFQLSLYEDAKGFSRRAQYINEVNQFRQKKWSKTDRLWRRAGSTSRSPAPMPTLGR